MSKKFFLLFVNIFSVNQDITPIRESSVYSISWAKRNKEYIALKDEYENISTSTKSDKPYFKEAFDDLTQCFKARNNRFEIVKKINYITNRYPNDISINEFNLFSNTARYLGFYQLALKYNNFDFIKIRQMWDLISDDVATYLSSFLDDYDEIQTLSQCFHINFNVIEHLNFKRKNISVSKAIKVVNLFPRLKKLNLSNSQLNSSILKVFSSGLQLLTELDLSENDEISDQDIELVTKSFPKLNSLRISQCYKVTRVGLGYINSHLSNLNCLDLSKWRDVVDEDLMILKDLKSLKKINLSRNSKITERGVSFIFKNNKNLEFINLHYCSNIANDGFLSLSHLTNLKILNLEWCKEIQEAALNAIIDNNPKLKLLNLKGCLYITSDIIKNNIKKLSNLTSLTLSGSKQINNQNISLICQNLLNLEHLHLFGCRELTDEVGVSMALNLKPNSLKSLTLAGGIYLTNKTAEHIANYQKNLQTLNLQGFRNLNKKGIASLSNLENLESLDLTWCYEVDDDDVEIMTKKIKKLNSLILNYCSKISDNALESVFINSPDLKILCLVGCHLLTSKRLSILPYCLKYISYIDLDLCSNITYECVKYFYHLNNLLYFRIPSGLIKERDIDKIRQRFKNKNITFLA